MMKLRFVLRATAAALPLLLAACSTVVGPNYKVPENAVVKRLDAAAPFLGAAEKPFSQQPLPAQWWRLYRDQTLDGLIDQALTANTDLRVAAANLARARAVLQEAEQLGRPSADVSASPGFGRAAGAASGVPHALPDRASYDTGLHVSYQLDLFGKIARAVEAANADTDSAQAASDLARVTVAAETTRAYAEACSAGQQIAIARQSVALQDKFVRSTAQRIKLGRGTALDNSRALGQLEQLRAAVPPLEAQRRSALYRLAVLTGETPAHFPQAVASCQRVPQLAATIPVGDGAALLRRRPDIRQAERTLAASTARIGVATAELYPQISLGLSAGSTGGLSGFGDANTWRYSLGPLISWSLPSTGTARMHIAQAEAGTAASLARFDGVVLNALRETETALSNYARELDRNAALRAARDQSALASNQAAKLFRFGRTDFLTTLDAERTLASSEAAVAASNAALATDQVTLFLALGGGWEQAPK
jgi:multidrug efflux system outer membrane protein